MGTNSVFVGYSTVNTSSTGISTLYDLDLINQDLLNAFNTRVGERVMRPDWGCTIWNYMMEPFDDNTKQCIIDEATRICQDDSRLELQSCNATEYEHGIVVSLTLLYLPYNVINNFQVNFENTQTEYYG